MLATNPPAVVITGPTRVIGHAGHVITEDYDVTGGATLYGLGGDSPDYPVPIPGTFSPPGILSITLPRGAYSVILSAFNGQTWGTLVVRVVGHHREGR